MIITKYKEFTMNELKGAYSEEEDVIAYLYNLKSENITEYVNEFIKSKQHRHEYMEDILLEIDDIVSIDKYNWVAKELKKF